MTPQPDFSNQTDPSRKSDSTPESRPAKDSAGESSGQPAGSGSGEPTDRRPKVQADQHPDKPAGQGPDETTGPVDREPRAEPVDQHAPGDASASPAPAGKLSAQDVLEILRPVEDPEIGLSIVDLGLIYGVDISEDGKTIEVSMTLTTPMCPYGPELIALAETALRTIPGIAQSSIKLVWVPRWDPREHASEDAKAMLGIW